MNNVRIFSCSNNLKNYNICIQEKVVGFRRMFSEPAKGDLLYISLKFGKESYCCAKATIGSPTDYAPWDNPELYPSCHKITNIEFCNPFSLTCLRKAPAGIRWGMKYTQSSKVIKDKEAINILQEEFKKNKRNDFYEISEETVNPPKKKRGRKTAKNNIGTSSKSVVEQNTDEASSPMDDTNDEKINIMDTFRAIKFKSETDVNNGLEPLVSENFYNLFTFFEEDSSILIPENRLFLAANKTAISGIPDALLITFDPDNKVSHLKIHIIEYECYGEGKLTAHNKFTYLNGTVIPQLIRFASNFSIVTANEIREATIKDWISKIVNYVDENGLENKIESWLKSIKPRMKTAHLISEFEKELRLAFEKNIKILLIIDELTGEQRDTIKNVIHSFKLSNDKTKNLYIDFSGYVVRLEQKLTYNSDIESEYALSFQDN